MTSTTVTPQQQGPEDRSPWRDQLAQLKITEENAHQTYLKLRQAIHEGSQVDPQSLCQTLTLLRKTSGDLEADLVRLDRIAQLTAIVERAPQLAADSATLDANRTAAITKEKAERVEIHERHLKASRDYDAAAHHHQRQLAKIAEAESELTRLQSTE